MMQNMTTRNDDSITLGDGTKLRWHDWPADSPRARLLIVHGLGEHARRYSRLAREMNDIGISVRAYDQRGHGLSEGKRGVLPAREDVLPRDLLEVFAAYAGEGEDVPMLLGHSLGGLVVLHAVTMLGLQPRGLIASAPGLAAFVSRADRWLASILRRVLPDLTIASGLKDDKLSHDAHVVRAYRDDPLVHDRISARLASYLLGEGDAVINAAAHLQVPTLLQIAGGDELVDPSGARAFAEIAPPDYLTVRDYPGLYHEIYNEAEPDRRQVIADLLGWLDARLRS